MKIASVGTGVFQLDVSRNELGLLNNALNEVCNGVHIADFEFAMRLGSPREEVAKLLKQICDCLDENDQSELGGVT